MTDQLDSVHMARALSLAERGLSNTDPNPSVGCVIVQGGEIVGEGWTAPAGGPHAERVALAAAGTRAKGATVYVTLEPCCHVGRTGPCTQALIAAEVERVVYTFDDPNPTVTGRGAKELRAAGIKVESGLLSAAASELNRGFISRMLRHRPWVRCKVAASLDGRTALSNGVSQWITSPQARADVHGWRARSSVILTGIGTVLADDPSLTARVADSVEAVHQPVRVILDSALRTPPDAKLLTLAGQSGIFTCHDTEQAERTFSANTWVCRVPADAGGQCDLEAVMSELGQRQFNDIWVEAGSRLNGALVAAGLVDELIIYLAPVALGTAARGMFDLGTLVRMDQRFEFEIAEVKQIGPDLRLMFRPSNVARPAA